MKAQLETATLGGGCFWCLEAVFREVGGVHLVEAGYAGGLVPNPTYAQICTGNTGHAEVVQVQFDPAQISYTELLEIFFAIHDPTQLNRQGHDIGTQYRSVIFTHSRAQHESAYAVINRFTEEHIYPNPIVTEVVPSHTNYWPAEADHQQYFAKYPQQSYCALVVAPKLAQFRKKFANRLISPH
ncbi:peptide-methionine (S)-S-oxide reductase MsrA [Mycoavidus sp. HKI]|uniref:peptide-methionine (S)-S-oxide reductase MsrA n=1 Tax=Mycoavidus sp. HKI TaxID=2840467 RepID=UPI001CBD85EB|nr:peptide-methionine (S)-S-oxide reductase MsrA [Mycoavidus sp. HKI]UAW63818.1 peptide-methionine (S)-S-oxide reductase MsrA [Mycoavidus sp. HKI]